MTEHPDPIDHDAAASRLSRVEACTGGDLDCCDFVGHIDDADLKELREALVGVGVRWGTRPSRMS